MKKYKLWTTYNINICIDWASDIAKKELKQEIEEFINGLCVFEYFELNLDKINWDRNYNLRYISDEPKQ